SEQLKIKSENGDIKELAKLLENPHSLLSVHDTVAQKRYDPELPPLPEYLNIEESSVKIIRLVKNKEPLGATIRRDDETGAIFVARIMRGGAADRSGLIHSGDEVKEVNGIPVDDKKPEDIIRILVCASWFFTSPWMSGQTAL
uniref:PDZ domain-containing protein n=1 Tax=Poecilia latipinna TaxID=48699 RepID=A0A3B3VZH8_9TELE